MFNPFFQAPVREVALIHDRDSESKRFEEYNKKMGYHFRTKNECGKVAYQIAHHKGSVYRTSVKVDQFQMSFGQGSLIVPALELVTFSFFENGKCTMREIIDEITYAQKPFGFVLHKVQIALRGAQGV